MNTNHTPESFSIQNGSNHFYICSDQRGYLAKSIGDSEDSQAVTRSIVETLNNAPALLAALEVMLAIAEQEARDTKYDNAKQTARAVIAQATGRGGELGETR